MAKERRGDVARAEVDEFYIEFKQLLEGQRQRVASLMARDVVIGLADRRDGSGGGGGGPGQKNGISDRTGLAAAGNVDPDHPLPPDVVHRRARAVMRALRDARAALRLIDGHLASMDGDQALAKPPPPCESCARADRVGTMRISSTASGRLERFYDLCAWCYDRVNKTGKLPTAEQVRRHHDSAAVAS